MDHADLLASGVLDLGIEAFRLLATLITGFAVLLGLALFACGIALTAAEIVGSLRDARKKRALRATLERAQP